jgi:hypothetical protein
MSWFWVMVAITAPTGLAFLAAWPLWRSAREMIVGNTVGALIITISVFALISREYIEVDRVRQRCEELNGVGARARVCTVPTTTLFTRFAVYGFIGLFETMGLFAVSEAIEHRRQRRGYSPEWR